MNKSLLVLALAASAAMAGCVKKSNSNNSDNTPTAPTSNEVHFNVHNYFGDKELELDGTYTNIHGEEITLTTFNYWISNIVFINKDGSEYKEPESYRLLRGNKPATLHFHVKDVPAGTYTGVKFIVGVDVLRDTTGAQTGALDPAVNGDMYWTWSTGYIHAKLEGTSPQSKSPNNGVTYHIGGIKPGEEATKIVTLDFGNEMVVGTQAGSIKIKADAAKWFGPGNTIKIAEVSATAHSGSATAIKIAENYKHMFSITSVGNE